MLIPMKESTSDWIDIIPESWSEVRLKSLFAFGKGLPITKDNLVEDGLAVISYGQIHSKANVGVEVRDILLRYVDESYADSNPQSAVKNGDFIFADTSEDLEGCGNFVYVNDKRRLFAGYHAITLCSLANDNNKYLAYLFQTDSWRSQIRSRVSGVKLFSISKRIISNCSVILPPEDEQKYIVRFLDNKCSKIDTIKENTLVSIGEYKKLKQSVITQAITNGICVDREMRDSGSVWYGEIPADWEMRKIKYLFSIKKKIAGEEGHTILSITQRGIVPKDLSKNEGQLASDYSNYQIVNVGDFAMNHMDLLTGWVDISKYEGVTSPDYRVFVLDDYEVNSSEYYLYVMQMCYMDKIFYGLGQGVSGLGRWRLQADKFMNFEVAVPPKEEQIEIVQYLDRKCSEIDKLISKKEQFVVELEAMKKSLIYEYVTGKKEVPNA